MSSDEDEMGGDPVCWAHLIEEPEAAPLEPGDARVVDLAARARSAVRSGPAWTGVSDDLNVNLLVFSAGDGVAEHVNAEVDVLIIGVAGEGIVTVEGVPHPLAAGQAVLVPKGRRRSTSAATDPFSYLTCHRRRGGLWPTLAAPKHPG